MVGRLLHSVEERTIPAAVTGIAVPGNVPKPPGGKYRSAEGSTLLYSRLEKWDGSSRLVLCNHGVGAASNQFGQNTGPGLASMALARTGRYIVLSIDGGPTFNEWGGGMAMEANLDAVAWARSQGVAAGKYAGMGWSMGGFSMLNWMRRDTQCVGAWLWVPAIDLNYFNSTAGYVPDYGVAVPNNATWTSEISGGAVGTGYRAQSQIQAVANVPVSTTPSGQGVSVTVADASRFADTIRGRRNVALDPNGITATYGGKDRTHLLDVISAGTAFTTGSGAGVMATQLPPESFNGYNPYAEYSDYSPVKFGATRKIGLALTSDDPTIPPAMADAWLAKVNNPNIALVGPKTIGGHTNMFGFYTDAQIVAFYDALDWS